METKPIMETISDVDAVAGMYAETVGEPDVDADDHQLHPIQNTAGLMETVHTGAKNVHTLLTDTRRMQPSRTWWAATPNGATKSPNYR